MSWIDQLNDVPCEIQTGDGRKYVPLWREAKRSKNYNTSSYNFINIPGTLVDRRMPEGNQYDLTIIFSGSSHLTTSEAFQRSADDKRPWTVTHPFWGSIKVQPLSIEEDKSTLNNTIFRIKVWETIPFVYPWRKQYANDSVAEAHEELTELAAQAFEAQVELDTAMKTALIESVEEIDASMSKWIKLSEDFAKFKKAVADAKAKINNVLATAAEVMRAVLDVVNFPLRIIQSIKDKIAIIKELFAKIKKTFLNLLGVGKSKNDSVAFESMTTSLTGALAVCAMSPTDEDYQIRTEVVTAMNEVRGAYEDYLIFVDQNAAERSDDVEGYTPDASVLSTLSGLIAEALANIYDYSFGAKQERVILLEEDSNAILLAHRFYGLDKEDENLSFFIRTNDLSMPELIEIKKGRKLYYYK